LTRPGDWNPCWGDVTEPVPGDVTEPRLGGRAPDDDTGADDDAAAGARVRRRRDAGGRGGGTCCAPPPPPPPRTKWTRRVPHPVLIGHAASLSQECDDGNGEPLDGCDRDCKVRAPRCPRAIWSALECSGVLWSALECSGVLHSPQARRQVEFGYRCDPGEEGSYCFRVPHCGDGERNVEGEECDDRNRIAGDGCSETCTLENSWQCVNPNGPAADICSGLVSRDFDRSQCAPCGAHAECLLFAATEFCRCVEG
jgi:cysteine-rich repeat protein